MITFRPCVRGARERLSRWKQGRSIYTMTLSSLARNGPFASRRDPRRRCRRRDNGVDARAVLYVHHQWLCYCVTDCLREK